MTAINDPILAFIRRSYAQALLQHYAIKAGLVSVTGLAQALGRQPTPREIERATILHHAEWFRLEHAREAAAALGGFVTIDEHGNLYRCDAAGRRLPALTDGGGFVYPTGGGQS